MLYHHLLSKKLTYQLTIVMLFTMLFSSVAYSTEKQNNANRLILFNGFILNAYYDDKYIEVKRLSPGAIIYGYGWLDEDRAFIAFQREDSIAMADIEVTNLKESKTTKLNGIGGVGESNFDVNATTGRIIFSHRNNINELIISEKSDSYKIVPLKTLNQFDYCWAIFWIDTKTVGCKLIQNNEMKFTKYSIIK